MKSKSESTPTTTSKITAYDVKYVADFVRTYGYFVHATTKKYIRFDQKAGYEVRDGNEFCNLWNGVCLMVIGEPARMDNIMRLPAARNLSHAVASALRQTDADTAFKIIDGVASRRIHTTAMIMDGVKLNYDTEIGACTFISHDVTFHGNVVIGRNCIISEYVNFGENVIVRDRCMIDEHAVVKNNVVMCRRCHVYEGAVIENNVFMRSKSIVGECETIEPNSMI